MKAKVKANPMNDYDHKTINALVSEFEAMAERGVLSILNERSYSLLIEHYMKEDIFDRAIEVINHALRNYFYSVEFYIKKAQLLAKAGHNSEALKVLDAAAMFSPNDEEMAMTRADILIQLGLSEEATHLIERLKGSSDAWVVSHAYILEGKLLRAQSLPELAFAAFRSAVFANSRNETAFEAYWSFAESNKKYEASAHIFEKIIDRDPYSYLSWFYYGHTQSYLGNYHEALEAYEYAFIINPDFELAYKEYADVCYLLKLYNKVLRCCEEYQERFGVNSDFVKWRGICYQKLGNTELARFYLHQALNLEPLDDELFYHLGECYLTEEKLSKAIKYFSKAISIEEYREEYYCSLANALAQVGDIIQAEDNYWAAINIAESDPIYWLNYANFLINNDRKEEALELLCEAEDNTVGNQAVFGKVACLFCMGRRQEALFRLSEIIIEDYESHPILFEMLPELTDDSEVINLIASQLG